MICCSILRLHYDLAIKIIAQPFGVKLWFHTREHCDLAHGVKVALVKRLSTRDLEVLIGAEPQCHTLMHEGLAHGFDLAL